MLKILTSRSDRCSIQGMSSSSSEKQQRRRHVRVPHTVTVTLREREQASQLVTANISRQGAFVVTDELKSPRQLVRLTFELPDGELHMLGVVAWTARAAKANTDQSPGMGIEFFSPSKQARTRWENYVQRLEQEPHLVRDAPRATSIPTRRKHPRHTCRFMVRLRDRDEMRQFFTKNIGAGGMLLRTPLPERISSRARLYLLHPQTRKVFPISARVLRVVSSPAEQMRDSPAPERRETVGVALAFDRLEPSRETALLTFIETGVKYLEGGDERYDQLHELRRVADSEPDSPLLLTALGQALVEELDTRGAVEAFEQALAMDPDCIPAHRGLYKAYTMLRDGDRANYHLAELRRLEKLSSAGLPTVN